MKTVLVVGLGEIGGTVYDIIKQSNNFTLYGIDLDVNKIKEHNAHQPPNTTTHIDVMHICIPVPDKTKFIKIANSYIQKHKPDLTIINSTTPIGTTMELHKQAGGLIAHSPCRGVHKNKEYMLKEFTRWTKYVGGATPEAGKAATEHFREAKLKTKQLSNCTDTEFAKLFETTYRTWMITFFQKMERLSRKYTNTNSDIIINFNEAVDFIEDTHLVRGDRPVMFPDIIGGHCLLPNSKLLLEEYEPQMLEMINESNNLRIQEMKDPKIAAETNKIIQRVSKFEAEQDKQVLKK